MSSSPFTKLDFYTLTFALGLSALAAGAVHLPILAGYAGLLVLSALVCVLAREREAPALSAPVKLVSVLWLGLGLLCLVQAVPLPLTVLTRVAPENADIWSRALRPFGEPPPAFASLSLAPGRSLVEALKAASYALVLLLSFDLARRHGPARLLGAVFAIGVLVAAVTAAHDLLEAQALYGFYRPLTAFQIAPLLNANTRAGFLSLTFFAGLGVVLRLGPGALRVFGWIGLALVLTEILICRSRGGTIGLVLGLVTFLALSLAMPRSSERAGSNRTTLLGVTGVGLVATLLAVLALRRDSWQGLFTAATTKLELFGGALRLIQDYPWLGVGRGAFGSVFPQYQLTGGNAVYEHAENFLLQWGAEWGLPVTLLALVVLARALWPLCTRAFVGRSTRRASLVGVLVLLVQNQVDLGLEVPAVSATLACVLGALFAAESERGATAESAPRARLLPLGAGFVLLCLGLLALPATVASPASERQALHEQLQRGERARPELWARLRQAILAFPADPYFPTVRGAAALAEGKEALPWAARAIERGPTNGPAHVLLARALWARAAREQAIATLRRALELDAGQHTAALTLVRAWGLSGDELARLVPPGLAGVPLLAELAARAASPERRRWLEELLARTPDDARARHAAALELVHALERGDASEHCRARREACLLELEQRIAGLDPGVQTELVRARLASLRGDRQAAEAILRSACAAAPADIGCGLALIDLALANQSADLDTTLRAVVAGACTSPTSCSAIHRALADRFAGHGAWESALTHYQRALQESPSAELYRAAATAADRLGRPVQAASLRRRAEASLAE